MRIGLNSPQAVLALLMRRRWWIIVPFVALSGIVVVLTKSLPKVYVSSTLILVEPRDVPQNFVVDLISGSVAERLKSIEQTVLSRTNLVTIIREFENQLPEFQKLNMDEKVDTLRGQISIIWQGGDVQAAKGAKPITYFRISYQNQNPALAQKIANKLAQLFIEKDNATRETQVTGTKDFFTRQLEKVAEELRTSEDRLKDMKAARQFELPERLQTNLMRLDSLTQEARTTEEALGRNATQRLTYEQMLAETPQTILKPIPQAPRAAAPVPGVATPEDQRIIDYRKAKLDYEQAAATNPPANPDVRQKKATMDLLRGKLSAEDLAVAEKPPATVAPPPDPATPGLPPGTEPNPRHQTLRASLDDAETEHKILLNHKNDVAKQIATYSLRVEATPRAEQELADISRQTNDLQTEYNGLKAKLTQAELSANLESEQKGGQFTVVDPANLPADPAKPQKALVAAGGTAASLILSLVFAALVDIAHQRIWMKSEIEAFWGVPVLVDIPEILTDSDLAIAKKKKWGFAASALAAAMVFSVCLYGIHLKHEFILQKLDPVLQKVVYR